MAPKGWLGRLLGSDFTEEAGANVLANVASDRITKFLDELSAWFKKHSEQNPEAHEIQKPARLGKVRPEHIVRELLSLDNPSDYANLIRRFKQADVQHEGAQFVAALLKILPPKSEDRSDFLKKLNGLTDEEFNAVCAVIQVGSWDGGIHDFLKKGIATALENEHETAEALEAWRLRQTWIRRKKR